MTRPPPSAFSSRPRNHCSVYTANWVPFGSGWVGLRPLVFMSVSKHLKRTTECRARPWLRKSVGQRHPPRRAPAGRRFADPLGPHSQARRCTRRRQGRPGRQRTLRAPLRARLASSTTVATERRNFGGTTSWPDKLETCWQRRTRRCQGWRTFESGRELKSDTKSEYPCHKPMAKRVDLACQPRSKPLHCAKT